MPKKTRRMKERAAQRRAALSQSAPAEETEQEERTTLSPSARSYTRQTFDYSHISGDLKRIVLFAGFFFAVMIALTFVIK